MTTPPASFGLWIRQRRRALDLTQEELAARVGCSISAVRKIESDERRPSRQVAELLAGALEIPPGEHVTFLRIARMELRVDHLASISAPAPRPIVTMVLPPSPAPPSPIPPAPAPPSLPGAARDSAPATRVVALPTPPTPLVGREVEVAQLASTLLRAECRLLTLVGAGGIGKSRLALSVAVSLADHFRDGVAFVALAALEAGSPAENRGGAASALARTLSLGQFAHADPLHQSLTYLLDKQLLLVLDSLEHLLDGGDQVVTEILRTAPEVKILVTSRETLNLQGEWLFHLRGLAVPDSLEAAVLQHASAVRLFLQSARRANVTFEPESEDLAAIARICRMVEGMPLAIELAASWVRVLSCREIAAEVERDWGFLAGSSRDMPARHRSMRAVFDQTWSLLTPVEREAMQALSVFRRGFRRDAALQVAGSPLLTLSTLAAKALLNPAAGDRLEIQELVRQYSAERLESSGGLSKARTVHALYFLQLAEAAEARLHGPDQMEWLDRLEADHENLRAALRWFAVHDALGGLRLASHLWWFWFVRGHWKECRDWFDLLLKRTEGAACPERAAAMARAANMVWLNGEAQAAHALASGALETARACRDETSLALIHYVQGQVATHLDVEVSTRSFEESLTLARGAGDRWSEARALYRLAVNAFVDDDLARARDRFEQSLALFRALGDAWGIYAALSDLAGVSRREGDLDAAQRGGEESLEMCRRLGFRQGIAMELLSLGVVAWGSGDFARARELLAESLYAFSEIDNRRGVADVHFQQGNCARWQGDLREAEVEYEVALSLSREMRFDPSVTTALHGLAEVALLTGTPARARACLAEALAIANASRGLRFYLGALLEMGARLAQGEGDRAHAVRFAAAAESLRCRYTVRWLPVEQPEHTRLVDTLRVALGDAPFEDEWRVGAALAQEEAIAALVRYLGREAPP